ncbi:unnamed protein product, partial [Rotaria sordida]
SGPIVRLVINEPDMFADILSRNNAQNYIKSSFANTVFRLIIGNYNLLVAEDNKYKRAGRLLNLPFHHTNLNSMVSIFVDRREKCVDSI